MGDGCRLGNWRRDVKQRAPSLGGEVGARWYLKLRPAGQGAGRCLASRGPWALLHLSHDLLDQLNGLGLPLGVGKREA